MTAFDLAAGLVLLVSALIGLSRGAVRELVTFCAFAIAALAAVFALPWSGPVARHAFHPGWVAKGAAVVAVFLIVYVGVRVAGGAVSAALHRQATLGAIDRTAGCGLGLVRGLVALGAFYLAFSAATPRELEPAWITGARLYPLSRASGRALAAVAPRSLAKVGGVGRALKARFDDGPAEDEDGVSAEPPASAPRPSAAANPYEPQAGETVRRRPILAVETAPPQAR